MPVKTDKREYRDFRLAAAETSDTEMVVEGYASVFDHDYVLYEDDELRVLERVDSGAFADTDMSDVIFQYNHEGKVYARTSNETLKVSVDAKGLKIVADLSGTQIGRELYEEIKGGYTTQMSYGYRVKDVAWEEYKDEDGKLVQRRTVRAVAKIYDVSAVSIPANDATSISVRTLTDGVIEKVKAERLEEAAEARRRKILMLMIKGGL